ncbi:hypothetical protein RBEAN4_1500 [Rickettsia bellii str. RML An4]|uniref:Uncharacterized protein n=1 Tax=Rickettsia bellii str. RML An4 TaxID=1359193 RepID=A0A0F3QD21_RICBE|nr:hypothetical protein RBEAN4_1500 [Rickettsia bellii str. RML An4]
MKTELPERSLHIRGRLDFIKSMSSRGGIASVDHFPLSPRGLGTRAS